MERSWTHPHYNSNNYNGDIALLYLSSAAVLNEYVIPICLPSPNLAALLSEEGRVGMVSGWVPSLLSLAQPEQKGCAKLSQLIAWTGCSLSSDGAAQSTGE